MTLFTKTAGLAAILATSVSGAALAQSASIGADTGAGASISTGDSGVSAGADVGADVASNNGNGKAKGAMNGNAANAQADTDMAANSDASGELNYGRVISSLQTGTNADADIAGITADSQIETMTVSEIQGEAGENAMALDNALADAEGGLTSMHDMIAANEDFSAMLETQGYAAEDVIAVYETADGYFEVLVDDRS